MKRTFDERVLTRISRLAKKHRWLKPFCICCIVVVLCCEKFIMKIASNSKRCVSLLAVCMVFMLSSSFTFPSLLETEETVVTEELPTLEQLALDTEVTFLTEGEEDAAPLEQKDIELLDDKDVLDGYDNTNLEQNFEVDTYTLDDILEEGEHYDLEPSAIPEESVAEPEQHTFDKSDWRLLLINKQHPVPADYTFTLGKIKGNMQCDERIIPDLMAMMQAAKEDGINLLVCSPYRDYNRQEVLFNRKIDAYMKKGMSYMEAYKVASQAVTVPGASEHQIGLALDIVCDSYQMLNYGFGETPAGKWLAKHSCEYGFILRYPLGKEYITSIEYEPWHFRYVGKEAATVITEKGITLEEFVDSL